MSTIFPESDYLKFLAEGSFRIQRSRASGRYIFYPRVVEPGTGSTDLEWVEASGRGTVYSTTIIRQKPPTPSYNLALIELAEGPRMMSRVVGHCSRAGQDRHGSEGQDRAGRRSDAGRLRARLMSLHIHPKHMLDYQTVKNWDFGDIEHTYSERDTMLYALGVGVGFDPLDAGQLRFVFENNLQVLPSMVAVLGTPGFWWRDPRTGADCGEARARRAAHSHLQAPAGRGDIDREESRRVAHR